MPLTVAVDIGGTFTDLLGYDAATGRLVGAKRPTTPAEMSEGVWDCFEAAGVGGADLAAFVHGSTVAINTIIERSGARTALVVTRGTRDVYAIGRGNRPDAYDVWFHRPRPLVPRHLTFEVDERIDAGGRVLTPFDRAQAARVAGEVAASGVRAVAVCFLHSWREPGHERLMGELLREAMPGAFVTVSHEILREYGEYERTSTAVLNAYVGPRVGDYLDTLERRLSASHFHGELLIMQSNGGVMAASTARALPVSTLESGPVGGFIAAARTAERLGYRRAIAFDMGGTTAKANLILDGQPQMARGYHIGGYATGQPMTLPVVDTVEVGAGGGSLARAIAGGGLEVGPESAGADPGPACYGKGGALATVTDANVVLGRIDPHAFLGGEITLYADAARVAVGRVAEQLGLTVPEAALAILQVAVLKMSLAVRQVSVERGYDPRDFAMVAFGGAGPLHASDVARALHVPTVVVPLYPGQFSAAGMLLADRRHDYVRTCDRPFDLSDDVDLAAIHAIASDLETTARQRLGSERSSAVPAAMSFSLDVRYAGQDFSLAVPIDDSFFSRRDGEAVKTKFGELHQQSFGYHEPGHALEVVTVRLAAVSRRTLDRPFEFSVTSQTPGPAVSRPVWFDGRQPIECLVYQRDTLPPGQVVMGPAILQEYASTTLLAPGDRVGVAASGDLVIQVSSD